MKARAKEGAKSKKKSGEKPKTQEKAKFQGKKGATSGRPSQQVSKVHQKSPGMTRTLAKVAALAEVDALLGKPGASAAGKPKAAPLDQSNDPLKIIPKKVEISAGPTDPQETRFSRCLIRAQKGEPGPIRLSDLTLDGETEEATVKSGQIDTYKKILEATPQAQPGRPLVNILGACDETLKFELLTLYELVMAARDLGREQLQVSLVRLPENEAQALRSKPTLIAPSMEAKALSPVEVAKMNGFLEVAIKDIHRDENLRQYIDQESPEFRNLIESIRTIGLQNPPVLEVRDDLSGNQKLVCVSGHRRLLALEKLGFIRVTCALKLFDSEKHRALAGLAENINREDLHFLDKADGYGLLAQQGMSGAEIAALLDADTRTVGKYLRAAAWDSSVKQRIRTMGGKATTRFLLNALAAGERTTPELHAMIDRFINSFESPSPKTKPPSGADLKRKLGEFCLLAGYGSDERSMIEKALRYLGYWS